MLYSKLFGKTSRYVSKQFESISHELLIKGGYINQVSSGIYSYLPLGKRVLTNIEKIIRQELNLIGAQEIMMPLLHPKNLWQKTDRWNTVEILFKTKSRFDQEYCLAPTHEEVVTPLAKEYIKSYRDLPLALYHITEKFRDEPRPKSGILRGKEFGMKDLYSFHASKEDFASYYQTVIKAYLKIFQRLGFPQVKITEASGGSFTKKFSHEFNVITPAGEVDLIYCSSCSFAQNKEITQLKIGDECPECKQDKLKNDKAIEIGNIFDLGTKFCEHFDFKYVNQNGQSDYPIMGCYGIGTSRLLGTIVEFCNDEKGIIWPESVTPFQVHLIGLDLKDEQTRYKCYNCYNRLLKAGIDVLFDDREDVTAGEKFADADLIGIPIRLVVSKRTGEKIEFKRRDEKESSLFELNETILKIKDQKSKPS